MARSWDAVNAGDNVVLSNSIVESKEHRPVVATHLCTLRDVVIPQPNMADTLTDTADT